MKSSDLYQKFYQKLSKELKLLPDKPDETPENTLCALWHKANGLSISIQKSLSMELSTLSDDGALFLEELVKKRLASVPTTHLIERQQFMGIEMLASADALVPRRETEILGNAALDIIKERARTSGSVKVLDVCTGGGNLALAFVYHEPGARLFASDLSSEAVEAAKKNAQYLRLENKVEFRKGDFLEPFEFEEFYRTIDVLTCNPPYISSGAVQAMDNEISGHEPLLAFDGGPFGVKILMRLLKESPKFLKSGGMLCFEVGLGQGEGMAKKLRRSPAFEEVREIKDKAGNTRAITARAR